MMGEPSIEDIQFLASLIGITSTESVKWLKAHNGNVNTAANAYYDNPNSLPNENGWNHQDAWNEDQFHSDKTDSNQSGQQQRCEDPWEDLEAFAVHPQDTLKPNVFDAAPSRPPSRVSTRAGAAIDHAGNSKRQLSVTEQENEELKQAMAISMNQTIPGQESGVTSAPGQYFGPATRPHYDNNSWTLTAPRSNTKEILLNPEPIDRRREDHTPAFLKPSTEGNRLSALIKILQAIPLSREALLNRDNTIQDYWYDNDWWDGAPIKSPNAAKLVHDALELDEEILIHETQRLIAFLEGTDRAYGSVDTLSNLQGIGDLGVDQMLARYLEKWRYATAHISPAYPLLDIFKSTGVKTQNREPRIAETHDFHVLELRIDETLADRGQTLYEAIDDILWTEENESAYEDVYLSIIGDLFIVEVTRVVEGSGLGIKIPSIWYSDRYLESSIPQVKEMQAGKIAIRKDAEKLDEAKANILRCQTSSILSNIDSPSFLNTATAFFERSASNEESINGSIHVQGDTSISSEPKRYSVIAEELKSLTARIAQKLKTIEDSKKLAQEKLDELSKLYTRPADNPDDPPHHKYTLRGVCATPSTVYVLERTQPDIKNDMLSTEAKDWQWWKLKYEGGDSKPISRTKVREIEVLKAAKDESRSALLVYASDEAISYEVEDLPPQLRNFVRLDNLSFTAELERATSPKPMTPTKRKADDSEDDDLMSKLYHSPQPEEDIDMPLSTVSSDPTLPAYASTSPSPPFSPSRPSRAPTRNLRSPGTYDDLIPRSLRATGPTIDPSSMMLNQEDSNDAGQEMQDRGGSIGMLQKRNGIIDSRYALGSYVPEITMEDREDEEVAQSKHIEFADPKPRR